jgi:glycosyltransferase involved in cell wall biosynthesis
VVNQYAVTRAMPGITRHFELAKLLGDHGWQATIYATPFNHHLGEFQRGVSLRQPYIRETIDGVPFCWLYSVPHRGNDWRRYLNMLSFLVVFTLGAFREQPPLLVIGSSPNLLAACGAWLAARWHRVPFLLEIRDVWPDTLVEMGLRSPVVIGPLTWLERFLYSRADRIIVLTEGIADNLRAKGVDPASLELIPNAALRPAPLDDVKRQAVRRMLGWDDKVVLIYAGAHGLANGLDQAIEAARLMPPDAAVLFAFLGDGPAKRSLLARAAGLRNVRFYDPLPRSEVDDILRAADIGLLSLRRAEIFAGTRPNKLFDYMSAALPILSTVGGEAWGIIQEADFGVYAEPGDPAALAQAVIRLATNPDDRVARGQRGFDELSRLVSREDTAANLAAVLASTIAVPGRAGAAAPHRRPL